MKSVLAALLLCLALSTAAAQTQTGSVHQIKIVSKWTGWGDSKSEITVTRTSGGYLANGTKVNASLIASLLAAIDAPAVMKPGLAKIGITQDWLNATAEAALAAYARDIAVAPSQRELFLASFKDLKNIERIVSKRFDGFWTDDYPSVTVTLTKTDESVITFTSDAQHILMLPWKISREGKKLTTYNADISRAIAQLMPEGSVNKTRLTDICYHSLLRRRTGSADCRLGIQVAAWVVEEMAALWETLGAESKAKPYLDQLRRHFTILTAAMEPDRDGRYTRWLGDDTPLEPHLVVTLTQPDFPMRIHAFLPFQNGKVENVEGLLSSAERCKGVMLSAHTYTLSSAGIVS